MYDYIMYILKLLHVDAITSQELVGSRVNKLMAQNKPRPAAASSDNVDNLCTQILSDWGDLLLIAVDAQKMINWHVVHATKL